MFLWTLNNGYCFLTVFQKKLENRIKGISDDSTDVNKGAGFIDKTIENIYDLKNNKIDLSFYYYTIPILLFAISLNSLYNNYKNNK